MRVLGIDPGLTRCGVGVVDVEPNRTARLVDVVVLRSPADLDTPRRLARIADGLEAIIEEHRPQAVALERVFARSDVSTIMGTAQISGVAMLIAARRGASGRAAHAERGEGRDHRVRACRQEAGRRDGRPDPRARRGAEARRRR